MGFEDLGGAFDAIVIGSGIGGLTAASLLARHAGRRVLVLERHNVAGGLTHVFRRADYEWDVGVHSIGRVNDAAGAANTYARLIPPGPAATPERFQTACLGPRSPGPGLYLTGADAAVTGVTGSMIGGVLAVSTILRTNLLGKIAKKP